MATQTEVPIEDSELDALMAELEAETSAMVAQPAPAAPVSTPPVAEVVAPEISEEDLSALAAELTTEQPAKTVLAESPTLIPVGEPERDTIADAAIDTDEAVELLSTQEVSRDVPETTSPKKRKPQLQFYLDVDKFKEEIAVSENNLDNAMLQQAGLFAFHAAEAARAEAQYARVKLRFEVVEAKLYDRHRKALAITGDKVTEKMVENAVKMDPEFLEAKNMVIEAEMLASFNKGAVESLRHRKDMIVQVAVDRREEYKGQVRVSLADASHADTKRRAIAAAA